MMPIPSAVVQYIKDHTPHPSALVGCRAGSGQIPYSCCEFDIAVFCENRKAYLDRVKTLNNATIEFIYFPMRIDERHFIYLKDMEILKDNDSFFLSSLMAKLKEKRTDRLLRAYGKRQIVESFFLYESITKNLSNRPLLSSLWLKISAYYWIKGILAMHGIMSSPAHELEQVRDLHVKSAEIASGITTALDCIGIERAGSSAILRSLKVFSMFETTSSLLWRAKAQWMLKQGRMADSYYYVGKMAAEYMLLKDEGFIVKFLKPIGILLDLSTDPQSIHTLHSLLIKASNDTLKSSV
ncbi:MAG: hypothetical protein M3146_01835 [Thermoproteota archaeon]|nr:hypothetical protein [Thermoproteota archaeon]